ncbi:MAG: DUF3221 domain-containing protein [Ruminococcaceae bacterium]|nr:DUF3221 domain-containing protein [Oscillospiraceae bacterium]
MTVSLLAGGVIGYFIGSKGYKSELSQTDDALLQTFYAEIIEINGSSLLVEGLSINDINFRGQFSLSIDEKTKLEWRYTEISLSDLDVGDRISITFSGEILESYPAIIGNAEKIQLLDDEK